MICYNNFMNRPSRTFLGLIYWLVMPVSGLITIFVIMGAGGDPTSGLIDSIFRMPIAYAWLAGPVVLLFSGANLIFSKVYFENFKSKNLRNPFFPIMYLCFLTFLTFLVFILVKIEESFNF